MRFFRRHKLLSALGALLALALLLGGLYLAIPRDAPQLYVQIRDGMTLSQVQDILGPHTGILGGARKNSQTGQMEKLNVLEWDRGHHKIVVIFAPDDHVMDKELTELTRLQMLRIYWRNFFGNPPF
jgi:hypothetical protein